ncbi:MAG TPA: hypothetical protein DCQ50_03635 [Chryseobacterium sp.]|nr:hypothetical protein [Chryseobacterium sp.]
MNILLSSIAKNDIRLLIRIFNAEKENKGAEFLEAIKESVGCILQQSANLKNNTHENFTEAMLDFPVNIHYFFENEENILITAVFKI